MSADGPFPGEQDPLVRQWITKHNNSTHPERVDLCLEVIYEGAVDARLPASRVALSIWCMHVRALIDEGSDDRAVAARGRAP